MLVIRAFSNRGKATREQLMVVNGVVPLPPSKCERNIFAKGNTCVHTKIYHLEREELPSQRQKYFKYANARLTIESLKATSRNFDPVCSVCYCIPSIHWTSKLALAQPSVGAARMIQLMVVPSRYSSRACHQGFLE